VRAADRLAVQEQGGEFDQAAALVGVQPIEQRERGNGLLPLRRLDPGAPANNPGARRIARIDDDGNPAKRARPAEIPLQEYLPPALVIRLPGTI
jgi:hypothetical protein